MSKGIPRVFRDDLSEETQKLHVVQHAYTKYIMCISVVAPYMGRDISKGCLSIDTRAPCSARLESIFSYCFCVCICIQRVQAKFRNSFCGIDTRAACSVLQCVYVLQWVCIAVCACCVVLELQCVCIAHEMRSVAEVFLCVHM